MRPDKCDSSPSDPPSATAPRKPAASASGVPAVRPRGSGGSALSRGVRTLWQRLAGPRPEPDRFIDRLGHELKTPLTSIRSLSEILRDNPALPAEMRQQYLKLILNDSHRLQSVIEVLLDGMAQPDFMERRQELESLRQRIVSAADGARRHCSPN